MARGYLDENAVSSKPPPLRAYDGPVNRADVRTWLDRYVEAWNSRDPDRVGALFTEDAVYRYRPYPGEFTEFWMLEPTEGPEG